MQGHYLENAFRYLQVPPLQEVHPSLHEAEHPHQSVQEVPFHKESPLRQGSTFYFLPDDVRHNHFQFSQCLASKLRTYGFLFCLLSVYHIGEGEKSFSFEFMKDRKREKVTM